MPALPAGNAPSLDSEKGDKITTPPPKKPRGQTIQLNLLINILYARETGLVHLAGPRGEARSWFTPRQGLFTERTDGELGFSGMVTDGRATLVQLPSVVPYHGVGTGPSSKKCFRFQTTCGMLVATTTPVDNTMEDAAFGIHCSLGLFGVNPKMLHLASHFKLVIHQNTPHSATVGGLNELVESVCDVLEEDDCNFEYI